MLINLIEVLCPPHVYPSPFNIQSSQVPDPLTQRHSNLSCTKQTTYKLTIQNCVGKTLLFDMDDRIQIK